MNKIKDIIVFRYGHRIVRDYRVSSHCSLVSRALGASKIIVCGEEDKSMKESVDDITERWGGPFEVIFTDNWKKELKKIKKENYKLIHLTMYGEQINDIENEIKNEEKICIIIGSQKVEREVYELCDYNVSVTSQPHSEIAALAIILDRLQDGKEIKKEFSNAKTKILPQKNGKKVIHLK
ncbi:MAG: tRNA (cytidine(56)-2'-O)-methyltransferase [Candidatus ainarchaeum sp.]|nr:tRNA (cytidine(56)-2'-O)-methyltransferase [Candidatus ainarchaeum sp.]